MVSKTTADRKRQILGIATELFSKRGYDKVTVSDLAGACGITEPAVYRHFKSKEAIYESVLDAIAKRLDASTLFESLESETDIEKVLKALAMHVITFFGANEDIHRLLLYSTLGKHSKAQHVYDLTRGKYVRFLRSQLDRLYEGGYIVEKNNEITARCFVGMVFDCALGQTLWKEFSDRRFEPAQVVANNVPIYSRGLKKNPHKNS